MSKRAREQESKIAREQESKKERELESLSYTARARALEITEIIMNHIITAILFLMDRASFMGNPVAKLI